VLDETGLRPLFEPVQRRVTLSTHAGVCKPDPRIFTMALARLRSKAGLDECLLITENPGHIEAARTRLRMSALRFRSGASPQFDFED
jgi:FMN phosphatase YigB (HAD superfamily)